MTSLIAAKATVETHLRPNVGALRPAVLGAKHGLISTASLVLGVTAAGGDHVAILMAGVAGLVAGSMSLAADEYVTVHAHVDSERGDLERERMGLAGDRIGELAELASIHVRRGLVSELAEQVASQLSLHDALGAHTPDELGMSDRRTLRPGLAAIASAASFAAGASLPILISAVSPIGDIMVAVPAASIFFLGGLGAVAAAAARATIMPSVVRVTFWGAFAMAVTAAAGALLGAAI